MTGGLLRNRHEMILDGRQPPTLQFEALRKSLPLLWEEQRKAIRGSI
jgi:hypothetical protein